MLKEYYHLLISNISKIKEALKLLNQNEEKILFVVNENNVLIGSLTDGDIRRWILDDGNLDAQVGEVAYKDTFFAYENYDLEKIKNEITERQITIVPILDANRVIQKFIVWNKIFENAPSQKILKKIDLPCVIMAGGKGTRLDPFTKVLPKPLIPIGDKTILEIIIEKLEDYGIKTFYLSLNHKAKIIKSYLDELENLDVELNYIYENKPLGTIGAVKQLEGKIGNNFLLTNCDILIDTDYTEVLQFHEENNNDITMVASLKQYNIPYGVCKIENGGTLLSVEEKPELNFLVNTGMYIINSKLLSLIPENEFFHVTHLIEKAKLQNYKIKVYPISENSWVDTGEWVEYKKAVEKFK